MLLRFWEPPGDASWWRDSEEDFSNRPHSAAKGIPLADDITADTSLRAWAAARAAARATSPAPVPHGAPPAGQPAVRTSAADGPARRWITLLRRLPLATLAISASPRRPRCTSSRS